MVEAIEKSMFDSEKETLDKLEFETQNNLTSPSYKSLKQLELDELQAGQNRQDEKERRIAEARTILIEQIENASLGELKELSAIRTMQGFYPEFFEVKALVKRFMED